jgi:hypothetical protein
LLIHFVCSHFSWLGNPLFCLDVQLVKVLRDFPLDRAMYIYSSICVYNRNRREISRAATVKNRNARPHLL